jgi:hypothetical protein
MMNKITKIGIGCGLGMLVMGLTQTARAQLYINSNTTLNTALAQDVFIGQTGHGGVTNPTVNIVAGATQSSSFYTMADGTSTVNMTGGSIHYLDAQGNAQVNVTGGTVTGAIGALGNSKFDIRGVITPNILQYNTSQVTFNAAMQSGAVVELTGSSVFNFQKGTVTDIYGMDSSRVELFINDFSYTIGATNVPKTTLIGGTRNFDQYILTGRLAGAAPITFNYWWVADSPAFVHINAAIPEPTTLALFAIGSVGFVGRLRRSRKK